MSSFVDFAKDQLDAATGVINSTPQRWAGVAADAYTSKHTEWVSRAATAIEALDQIRQRLTTARTAYQAALDANCRMFES